VRAPARPRIRRRWIVIAVVVLAVIVSINSIVRFYTDLLWFGELRFATVFWKIFWTRAVVGTIGGVVAGIVLFANLEVARRGAPRYRFVTPGGDIAEQYRSVFRPYARLANIALAAVVAFFTGLSTSAAWSRYLLWRNARPFGTKAPAPFGHDVSFYVFGIPFQRSVISWLFGILVVSLIFSALAHLLNGSIQPEQNRVRVATIVKVHVSVLLGFIALLKAWSYRLDQFDLVFSPRGVVTGASYTDVHAQLPAFRLLMIIALIAAVIFFANVFRFRGWLLPGAALGLWVFTSIVLGAIYPAIVQRFQVAPNESLREQPYIARNITATRAAFGLDRIALTTFPLQQTLTPSTVAANAGTINNVRVWDPTVLQPTFERLQAIRTYYNFDDVDIDRYMINGRLTQVMLAGREIDTSKLPSQSQNWVNSKLIYTHGYGAVAVAANAETQEGLPDFLIQDIPPSGPDEAAIKVPALYYGTLLPSGSYAVVKTKQSEIDYPSGEQQVVTTSYKGDGGITMSPLRRVAFALRFGASDIFLSRFITPQSRLLMRRNVVERVSAAAPFLSFDGDPYLVIADGKLYWILDGYTSTDRYPYSERVDLGTIPTRGNQQGEVNYMRNSVKAVVDAYNGTTKFYVVDPSDALLSTYQAAFPALFTPIDQMPASLRAHLRYPEDLFKIQMWEYRTYHVLDPRRVYSREDVWDIANDPNRSSAGNNVPMDPYYVIMKLPGEKKEEFVLMLPFTPKDRTVLNGWVAARMDPGHYGEMIGFNFPRGGSIEGPENIAARIEQNDTISRQFTLWEGAGSMVRRGNLYVLPVGNALTAVEPIYLAAAQEQQSLPELRRVIVVVGTSIGFEPTLQGSLSDVIGGQAPAIEQPTAAAPTGPAQAPSATIKQLLDSAIQHFNNADAALRRGDLATYQSENQAGVADVQQAQRGG
jgi:uncharacterized membrane protein (UPF0182 family)